MQSLHACGAALLMAATTIAFPAAAQDLVGERAVGELSLSNDTLQVRYRDAGRNVEVGEGSRASAALFLSESRDLVLFGDLLFPASVGVDRFQLLFGPRAYAAMLEEENNDVFAISLGAEARFALSPDGRLAVSGQAFYAPDILTFGTADSLTDLSARLEFEIQPRLTLYGGMRWFEFELIDDIDGESERTLQEELFAGLAWQF